MEKHGGTPITFSCESGVYDSDLDVEIEAPGLLPRDAVICYTIDGTEPTIDSPHYEGAVHLSAETVKSARQEAEKAAGVLEATTSDGTAETAGADYAADNPASGMTICTLRARICWNDEMTDSQYAVYCLGNGIFPCPDSYVVCIDTDPADLYDYEKGILVTGKNYDDNNQSKYHGNFMKKGEEWTRLCHVALFDGEGNLVTDCNAGVAVSGGMSRRLEQKALNLAFGAPYGGEDEKLELDIFPDAAVGDAAHVGRYSHLRLRARSQIPRTFRETMVSKLANDSSCRLVSEPYSGIVFLNGEFYTLAELSPTFSNSYLAHRFDLPDTQHIEKKKGKDISVFKKLDVISLFEADLTKEENRRALEAAVDMDDFLLFYAFDCLDDNLDWPRNNVEAWRWTGEYDPARPYTDGRLRFMIYDADKTYNTDESIADSFGTDSFVSMMENTKRGYQSPFRFVMKSDEYRDRFVTILCDLMNTSFETEHVLACLEESYMQNEDQYRAFFSADYMGLVEEDYRLAQEEASSYNDMLRRDLFNYFGMGDRYRMELSASEGMSVTWNNMYLAPGDRYACDYYPGVSIYYTATPSPGWRFDHWEINGQKVEADPSDDPSSTGQGDDQTAEDPAGTSDAVKGAPDAEAGASSPQISTLTVDGSRLQDGTCTVRAVAVPVDGERLVIAEVSAAGSQDWIRLYNAGTTSVGLGRYCISDNPDHLQMFRLPKETLLPGESVRINGSGNETAGTAETPGAVHDENAGNALCTCNFGLRHDEVLYLTPDDGLDLPADSLRIPRMSVNCSYGRRDDGGIFAWFDNREN
ncbi:MAG: CotH kinase family protein [Lachnospiraceae bacterium]|nr:CotH kinase family protein [Lachnospiraceae bacterium]